MVPSRRWPQLRCGRGGMYFSENAGPLVHEARPAPRTLGVTIARRQKMARGSLTAPDGLCPRPTGAEGSEPVLHNESCVSSGFHRYGVRLILPETVESLLVRRAVSVIFCPNEAEGALRTWSVLSIFDYTPAQ